MINKPTLDVPSIKCHVVPILKELYCVSFSCTLGSGGVFPFGRCRWISILFLPAKRIHFNSFASSMICFVFLSFVISSTAHLLSIVLDFLLPFVSVSSVRFQAASIVSVQVSLCVFSLGFRSVYYFPSPHITQLPLPLLLSPPLYR